LFRQSVLIAVIRRAIIAACCISGAAMAHEAHGSSALITLEGNRLEVLQTTPIKVAQKVASDLSQEDIDAGDLAQLLTAISKSWEVSGSAASCELSRQAHRVVHHDTQLQMRFLFECQEGERPQRLATSWLLASPSDHFMNLTLQAGEQRKTVIVQRDHFSMAILDERG